MNRRQLILSSTAFGLGCGAAVLAATPGAGSDAQASATNSPGAPPHSGSTR